MSTQNATQANRTAFILKRIAQALDVKGDDELAKALGIARNTLSTWRNRDSTPYKSCEEVAKRKGVSIDWLLTGEGPMYRQPAAGVEAAKAANDGPPERAISEREWKMVQMFRTLPEGEKDQVQGHLQDKQRLVEMEEKVKKLEQVIRKSA